MSRRKRLLKKALEPRLEEAQKGTRAVFFVDAAHFVLTAYLGFLWCFVRQFIRAPAGRQRFNVLGALTWVRGPWIDARNLRAVAMACTGRIRGVYLCRGGGRSRLGNRQELLRDWNPE